MFLRPSNIPKSSDHWEMLPAQTSGAYDIQGTSRQFMEIVVHEGSHVQFLAYQSAALRQTGSPRLFILKDRIFGEPLERGRVDYVALYNSTSWFRIEDKANNPDTSLTQPYTWAVDPGTYFLCLQNMENALNAWTIQFDN